MTAEDGQAFAALIGRLVEVYQHPLSDVLVETYWEALQDYELEYLEPAAAEIIRISKWFPKPVELRETASRFRVEARRKALPESFRSALEDRRVTVDEAKAFLAEIRQRVEAETGRQEPQQTEIPRKGAEALSDDVRRLDALGGRDMTDEKRLALEQFRRYGGDA